MATSCFGRADRETPELDPFAVEHGPPGTPPQAGHPPPAQSQKQDAPLTPPVRHGAPASGPAPHGGLPGAAPSDTPEDAELPLEQMTLTVEDGLLMVFGPEGDPVPPYAFAAAAARRPDVPLGLPGGATAPASRVAQVLDAQVLARLGPADQGTDWIFAMLRDDGRPEGAAEDALRAEQGLLGAVEDPPADAGEAASAPQEPWEDRDAAPEDHEAAPAYREALDQASLEQAAASIQAGPEALPRLELDFEDLAARSDAGLDLDFSADRFAGAQPGPGPDMPVRDDLDLRHETSPATAAWPDADGGNAPQRAPEARPIASVRPAAAEASAGCDFDPDSIVLVVIRGVPEGASLSAGLRDDDGSWSIDPVDLSTVTISLAPRDARQAQGVDGDLSITGIALAEDGELVAISETVPLADYLGEQDSDGWAGVPHAPEPGHPASGPEPGTIPLEVDPQAWAGEAFDALVIRDLPAGARLSAGVYDPAIAGWVLRPQDLGALAIVPPAGERADFTVTLMGIALRPGDADAARVLARLPVKLA